MGNPTISEISRIINSDNCTRVKLSKIKDCFYKVGFLRSIDVVPSLSEPNIYFAFIDNRECEFKISGNKIISDSLTELEKHEICEKLNSPH